METVGTQCSIASVSGGDQQLHSGLLLDMNVISRIEIYLRGRIEQSSETCLSPVLRESTYKLHIKFLWY